VLPRWSKKGILIVSPDRGLACFMREIIDRPVDDGVTDRYGMGPVSPFEIRGRIQRLLGVIFASDLVNIRTLTRSQKKPTQRGSWQVSLTSLVFLAAAVLTASHDLSNGVMTGGCWISRQDHLPSHLEPVQDARELVDFT